MIANEGLVYANAHFFGYPSPRMRELLSTLTFTNGLGFFNHNVLNAPTWSISTEFYTYILFAIFCYLLRGRKLIWFLSIAALAMYALTMWGSIHSHQCLTLGKCLDVSFDFGFPRCISTFFLGALAAAFCQTKIKFNIYRLQAVGMILLVLVLSTMDRFPMLAFLFPLIFAILVISVSTDKGLLAEILKMRLFQIMGQRSFSIYLMHASVLLFFREFLTAVGVGLPLYLFALFYVFIIIIISGFTYRFIENPFRIMFNSVARRRKKSAGESLAPSASGQ